MFCIANASVYLNTPIIFHFLILWKISGTDAYPIIACIGQKLQFAFSNPKMDETYYFSLFATNRQTNFTYQYGTISTNGRLKPITLKDGKAMFKNLKKMDGDALFRYKVTISYFQLDKIGCFLPKYFCIRFLLFESRSNF